MQNDITSNYVSTTHAVHDFDQSKLLHIAALRLLEKINSLTFGLMLTLRMLFDTEAPTYLRISQNVYVFMYICIYIHIYIDGLVQDGTPLLRHWGYVFLALIHHRLHKPTPCSF